MHQPRRKPRGSRLAVATVETPVRCAIYTRKSTDEGLDSDYNTLDAQREIAESYIASQRHEGWVVIPNRYDDGGFSGATTNRPAFNQLLADIAARRVDCVVVYRYDRLSRTVFDFLQFFNFLKEHSVGFVSVSERFDTSTPYGEMALNLVLSMAQCERKVAAERTRDKIQASRRHGKWTGGMPPLGYDVAPGGGKLLVNKEEEEQVRAIFELYVDNPSLIEVSRELNLRGWRRKSWWTKTGHYRQGKEWDRNTLSTLLRNPLFIGLQKLGEETFPGEHKAIVSKRLFNKVQKLLDLNLQTGGARARNKHGALLRGLLRCGACDSAMCHSPVKKKGKLYRYYRCSSSERKGADSCPTRQIQADQVERFVVDQIRCIGVDPDLQQETFRQALEQVKAEQRGLRAETKRLNRDLRGARQQADKLIGALAEAEGAAADAVHQKLEETQVHIQTMDTRLEEIRLKQAHLDAQNIDPDNLSRTLEAFDPIWDVLLTQEKERVLGLLIDRVTYDGGTQEMNIDFKLSGISELAQELGDES